MKGEPEKHLPPPPEGLSPAEEMTWRLDRVRERIEEGERAKLESIRMWIHDVKSRVRIIRALIRDSYTLSDEERHILDLARMDTDDALYHLGKGIDEFSLEPGTK